MVKKSHKESTILATLSGLVALCSFAFYTFLTVIYGSSVTSQFIASCALASILQVVLIPQGWVYILASLSPRDSIQRYQSTLILESLGSALGICILILLINPFFHRADVTVAFIAYAMAGSTSSQGLLRFENKWGLYSINILLPSIIRLGLVIWGLQDKDGTTLNVLNIILIYLLLPELIRFAVFNFPRFFQFSLIRSFLLAQKSFVYIYRNWFYDAGSSLIENIDKLVIQLIASPGIMLTYFFARKVTSISSMLIEPYYSTSFSGIIRSEAHLQNGLRLYKPLANGYKIAVLSSIVIISFIIILPALAPLSHYLPNFTTQLFILFVTIVIIDSLISANRWARYASILTDNARNYFLARIGFFCIFMLITIVFSRYSPEFSLSIGLFVSFLIESLYIRRFLFKI
jgi:hypothetical protein